MTDENSKKEVRVSANDVITLLNQLLTEQKKTNKLLLLLVKQSKKSNVQIPNNNNQSYHASSGVQSEPIDTPPLSTKVIHDTPLPSVTASQIKPAINLAGQSEDVIAAYKRARSKISPMDQMTNIHNNILQTKNNVNNSQPGPLPRHASSNHSEISGIQEPTWMGPDYPES